MKVRTGVAEKAHFLASPIKEFAGTFVGIAVFICGVAIMESRFGSSELSWLLIGTGFGTALTDMLNSADRRRAEARHREQLTLMLGTLSGTQRQALRFGVALADMMTLANWPSDAERRFLTANSSVLGVETELQALFTEPASHTAKAVQTFLLRVRATRGRHAADGFMLGYRLQRMAHDLEAQQKLSAEDLPPAALIASELQRQAGIIAELESLILRSFPMEHRFSSWIMQNLDLVRCLPENRVSVIRYSLRILWHSRHLQSRIDACECVAQPCEKRKQYLDETKRFPSAQHVLLPDSFGQTLLEYEAGRRNRDFAELERY